MGRVRKENEDSFKICEPSDPLSREQKGVLLLLADGMGGLDDGGAASRLAVETAAATYYATDGSPRVALEDAVKQANRAIFSQSRDRASGRSMGSTITALSIAGGSAYVAQVGDSRAYCYRGGKLHQVTRDHSLVRELVDLGHLQESSPHYSVHRNILTRGLGLREDVAVDIFEIPGLEVGDRFVLTSDGLHELLRPQEIAEVLARRGHDLDGACEELVAHATERGGPDNITVILAEIAGEQRARPRSAMAPLPLKLHPAATWILPLGMFLSFVAGVLLTLWLSSPARLEPAQIESLRQQVRTLERELRAATGTESEQLRRMREAVKAMEGILNGNESARR
jgi:protein phosphatase